MPNTDKNTQKPWQTNQVESQRPNLTKTPTVLSGYIANSMNGGHNRTIAFKKVMAGEKHREYKMYLRIRMLTPQTPAYQNVRMTVRSYWCPDSAVWTGAEKYYAQRGGATVEKITEKPNYGGKVFPLLINPLTDFKANFQHTTAYRDHWMSSYIPRMGYNEKAEDADDEITYSLPAGSILPLRGRICIYNFLERNKQYDRELPLYKGDTVSQAEWDSLVGLNQNGTPNTTIEEREMRARRDTNYYTDLTSEAQGEYTELTDVFGEPNDATSLVTWADFEHKLNELRAQAQNAEKTDWQIISEIRGSAKLDEARPSLIGQKTFRLQYSSVTQNTYNTNTDIREEFTVMGQQGAYSYTEVEVPCYAGFEAKEDGYIHIIATVTSDDTVIESAFDRNELNITPMDEYRPDLSDQKLDVMYNIENGSIVRFDEQQTLYQALGFKRKWNEYFRLNSVVAGDMTYLWYQETELGPQGDPRLDGGRVITNSTYQLFETDRFKQPLQEGRGIQFTKYFWKDYTDIQINKNLAIPAQIDYESDETSEKALFRIKGNNQIDLVGRCVLVAELPMENGTAIKHNFTEWGEH